MEVEVPIALTSYFASSSGRTCKGSVGIVPREFADPKCLGNNQWQWRDEMEMPASWVGENKF